MPVYSIHYTIVALISYLVGSFPTGVILTKQKYGIDVREMGSGNIGATNVTRVFGWYAGIVTLIIDFTKGFLPLYILKKYYPETEWLWTIAALGLVIGHCFSIYLKFRGGKGVATGLGAVIIISPLCGAIAALVYIGLILVTKISAVGSLGGILSCLIFVAIARPNLPETVLIVGVSLIVLTRHTSNIRRLIDSRKVKK